MSLVATTPSDQQAQAEVWVEGFIEGWRAPAGPDEFFEHFRPMVAPDVRMIQPQLPNADSHDAFRRQFIGPLFTMLPDVHAEVEDWAARGDTVLIAFTLIATLGGRAVRWRAVDRIVLRDGVATVRESYFDPTPLLVAVVTRPRAWPRFLAARAKDLAARLRRR